MGPLSGLDCISKIKPPVIGVDSISFAFIFRPNLYVLPLSLPIRDFLFSSRMKYSLPRLLEGINPSAPVSSKVMNSPNFVTPVIRASNIRQPYYPNMMQYTCPLRHVRQPLRVFRCLICVLQFLLSAIFHFLLTRPPPKSNAFMSAR